MKKPLLITLLLILIVVMFVSGYLFIDRLFPRANPLKLPSLVDISSIYIHFDSKRTEMLDDDFEELLLLIGENRPTRKMSVNDTPYVDEYFIITINTENRQYRYFLYEDNGRAYLESPYEGVYRLNKDTLDFISEYQ